ncbi:MAG: flavodoxin family protein [Nitrososphaerota archaeon]|jgi:multimeric flavodoxin WrbA|nr:flavodoxin family protein [Nitrososphaerota archaeon]
MKIIGFIASPRKEGNTAWIINRILEGAKEQGAKVQAVYSSDLDIRPCKGCLGCVQSDKCGINDDMQGIYNALKQADALVLGSPVYMGQMSGQAKIFTDRLFAHIVPRFSPRFKEAYAGKKLVLVFTQGNPNPDIFKEYFDYTKKMFQMLEFDVKDMQVIAGMRNEPAYERRDLDMTLRRIGASLVSELFME